MVKCPACYSDNIGLDSVAGTSFCYVCGVVVEENNIVAEVGFTETASGAAAVQGTFIGLNATGARINGPMGQSSGVESSEVTLQRGLTLLRNYQYPLKLGDSVITVAERHFRLAHQYKFTKGRYLEHVIAVCLYMGCKHQKTSHMLIDFADTLKVNIFTLGAIYLKWLRITEWPEREVVEPSIFITRFVSLLEFGEETAKVAQDAVRIAARFKQDWIHEGRRTAGICGAAIYLAAQMNNFRRSIQEIVQVVKIADTTVIKRLEEFSVTPSGQLTVSDFKTTDALTEESNPPAFTRARELEKRLAMGPEAQKQPNRKRKRKREDDEDADDDPDLTNSRAPSPVEAANQGRGSATLQHHVATRLQEGIFKDIGLNADDLGIIPSPAPPDPEITTTQPTMRPDLDPDPLVVNQIQEVLESGEGRAITRDAREVAAERVAGESHERGEVEILDDLKDLDDEELDQYICTPEEEQAKQRIWMELNYDYLRKLHAKTYHKQTGEEMRPKKKRKPKTKQTFVPGKTAMDSVKQMVDNNRKKWTKKINYDLLGPALNGSKASYDYGDDDMDLKDEDEDDDKDDEKTDYTEEYGYDTFA